MATRAKSRKDETDKTVSRSVGAGVGAAGGAAAGAAIGTAVAPGVGTAVGAVIGGVAGLAGGYGASTLIDPDEEAKHWKKEYPSRPYYKEEVTFNEVRPAYCYGVEAANKYQGKSFAEVQGRLSRNWPKARGESRLPWSKVKGPIHDAYDRAVRLHEERLRIDKEQVHKGEVGLRKETKTERQRIDVPVEREEVVITRRPAHGAGHAGEIEHKGEEIRIPVHEERVRVTKEVVPTEEVSVERRKAHGTEHVEEDLRREELRTEKTGDVKVRDTRATGK
jgi:uncharacterized protein (TIGR02271 family)